MVYLKLLGGGAYGTVSLYREIVEGRIIDFAVKKSDDLHAASLQSEIEILSKLKGSPRIVQVYGDKLVEEKDGKGNKVYSMLMEYAPGGSLLSLMNTFPGKKLPDAMIREFTFMLLEGLAAIHDLGYVHCDLKPGNILVFPSTTSKCGFKVKISDFGLTRREGDDKWWEPTFLYAGTSIYMSPESVSYGETGKALDLWSLGCNVLEMYTGKPPWWHTNFDLKDLKNCYKPLIPKGLPEDADHFINVCLLVFAFGRRTAPELLEHDFVRAYVNKEKKEHFV